MHREPSRANKILDAYKQPAPVYVTRPRLPSLDSYQNCLKRIWESHWLTNNGQFHVEFEEQLASYLGVEYINLFVNGTIGLLVALQALGIDSGEVITTPFTFAASTHAIHWNKVTPVFCDIDEKTFNIDPDKIEELITPDTKAILAVHVYGTPCDVEAIQTIADKHGLYVIYDAAHAFGVKIGEKSILNYGDMSVLSFHATKLFSSIEGGAVVSQSQEVRDRIQSLKNFGIADEETVIGPGINGKMNEFQAAFGLLGLKTVEEEVEDRRIRTNIYRKKLAGVPGISCMEETPGIKHNYGYFPIRINSDKFGCDRNELYDILRKCNIFARKYFYPLCSNYPCYSELPSSRPELLPVANRIADQILCLPLYGQLDEETVEVICTIIEKVYS
jgi:dTDP-4-amino-4,6-dideoxygalactose transaminase